MVQDDPSQPVGGIACPEVANITMTDKIAELLLVLLGSLGLLLARGIRAHYLRAAQPGRAPDPELLILAFLAAIALVVLPLVDLFSQWLDFADFSFSHELAWTGLGIGAAAVALFCRTLFDSIRYRSGDTFEGGLFRFVRHPFYTALLLWALAQLLLLQNWLVDLAAILTFLAVYALRLPRDEQHLLERFGHRYLVYMERTGTLWPRWNGWRQR